MLQPRPKTDGDAAVSLCPGDLLGGRYRLEALVHARRNSMRFDATDLATGARVSAQVLSSVAAREDCPARTELLDGARRARDLTGFHIARVLDAGVTSKGHPWIIGEHLASRTLASHLVERGALPQREAVDVALALCDALAEVHDAGLVHAWLSPHSVHVGWSASGLAEVKLAGAGTAQAIAALTLGAHGDVEAILRAPEQLRSTVVVNRRSDVWAVGVLLHTMISGSAPFTADTPSGASLSVILDAAPALAGIPDALARVITEALARDPRKRPRSTLDLADALVPFGTNPEGARANFAARRASLSNAAPDTDPDVAGSADDTIEDANAPFFEASSSHPSLDVVVDVPPSVRDLRVAPDASLGSRADAGPHGSTPPLSAPSRPPPATRRRGILAVALAGAAAALVVIATEGKELLVAPVTPSAAAAPSGADAPAFAAARAPAPAPAEDDLPPLITLPDAPLPPASSVPAPANPPLPAHTAPRKATRPFSPAPASTEPPSKPSPAGSADDSLRRFLDDRR